MSAREEKKSEGEELDESLLVVYSNKQQTTITKRETQASGSPQAFGQNEREKEMLINPPPASASVVCDAMGRKFPPSDLCVPPSDQ